MEKTIASKVVTYDFARLMDGATEVKCSEFGDELIKNMDKILNIFRLHSEFELCRWIIRTGFVSVVLKAYRY